MADDLTPEEQGMLDLVAPLREEGEIAPLVAVLKGPDCGPERARDALAVLGELDPSLLVQVALDALIAVHFDDPGAAEQTRRVVRGARAPGTASSSWAHPGARCPPPWAGR